MKTYSIVGMNFTKTEDFVKSLAPGKTVFLVREPSNPYDANAVAVWIEGRRVGYIPKAQNKTLAGFIDQVGVDFGLSEDHPTVNLAKNLGVLAQDAKSPKSIPAKFVRSPNSGYPMVEV